jgi:hypothetical protein
VTEEVVTPSGKAVSLELVRDERIYREGFDRSVQEKKAVADSSVLVQEAARLADQGKKEEAKEILGKAVKDEMEDMNSEPAKAAQKAIKYRAYETLQQR